jgi:hypothetical protein
MRYFLQCWKFWECWCEDSLHFGDNLDCPAHGMLPAIIRVTSAMIVITVIFLILGKL